MDWERQHATPLTYRSLSPCLSIPDHILDLATTLVKAPVAASLDGGPAAAAGVADEKVKGWLTRAVSSRPLAALLATAPPPRSPPLATLRLVTIPDVADVDGDPVVAALVCAAGPPPSAITCLTAAPVVCASTGRTVGALLIAAAQESPPASAPTLAVIGAMLAKEGAAADAAAGARAVGVGLVAAVDGGGAPYLVVHAPSPPPSPPPAASTLPTWTIVHASGAAAAMVGVPLDRVVGAPFWGVFGGSGGGGGGSGLPPAAAAAAAAGEPFKLRGLTPVLGGEHLDGCDRQRLLVTLSFRPASEGVGSGGPPLPPPTHATPGADTSTRLFFAAMQATHGDVAGVLSAPPAAPDQAQQAGGNAAVWAAEAAALEAACGRATPCAPPATRPPFPGLVLGPLLGAGAYGRVYRGTWAAPEGGQGTPVAVKVVDARRAPRAPDGVTPLEAACASAAAASSRNVVACLAHADVAGPKVSATPATTPGGGGGGGGTVGGETWLVLEMCDLGSLGEAIDDGLFGGGGVAGAGGGASRHATIARTAADVAGGLASLHAAGWAHGDLAAGNVLLASTTGGGEGDGRDGGGDPRVWVAKITDFGLATALGADSAPLPPSPPAASPAAAQAAAAAPYGTVPYLPPERLAPPLPGCAGPPPPSPAGDVYALGALLWGMLAGRRPWAGAPRVTIMHAVGLAGGGLGPPPGRSVPPVLAALTAACLARDPAARPTAVEVEARLRAALASGEVVDLS